MRLSQTNRARDKSPAHNSLCVDTRWGFTITPAAYSRRNLFPSVAGLRGYIIKGRVHAGVIAAPPSARHSRPDVTARHYHTESLLTPVTPVVFRWSTYESCQDTRASGFGSCIEWLMAVRLVKCWSWSGGDITRDLLAEYERCFNRVKWFKLWSSIWRCLGYKMYWRIV